jgi:flagellar assembly protein FliH
MSSSTLPRNEEVLQSEPFFYLPSGDETNGDSASAQSPWNGLGDTGKAQLERTEKEAHARGVKEGEARAKSLLAGELQQHKSRIDKAIQEFAGEREEYFRRIEPEVVHLALAIAKKILHREAQVDPLLLTGLVHVALEKLDAGTRVRLRANPSDMHFWNEHFAERSGTLAPPELIGDAALSHGECSLETELGSTQISLETQLKEIEQGFFDLLEQRPRIRA